MAGTSVHPMLPDLQGRGRASGEFIFSKPGPSTLSWSMVMPPCLPTWAPTFPLAFRSSHPLPTPSYLHSPAPLSARPHPRRLCPNPSHLLASCPLGLF